MMFIFALSCHLRGGFTEFIGCVLSKTDSKSGPKMLLEGRHLGDILMSIFVWKVGNRVWGGGLFVEMRRDVGDERGVDNEYSQRKYLELLLQLKAGAITALNTRTARTYLGLGAINNLQFQ